MVSIMPGIDGAEPDRTETRSGLSSPPKRFRFFFQPSDVLAHFFEDR